MTKKPVNEWKIPRLRIHLFHKEIQEEIRKAVDSVVFADHWKAIKINDRLEEEFCKWFGCQFATTTSSGTAALIMGLLGVGVESGDEVIVVANSDMSNTNAIDICGAKVVLCDVNESDYTMDIARVEELITPRTRAIMPVDIYGHPANVRELRSIADKYRVMVVEDACLGVFAKDYGQRVGAYADVTVFSTTATKPINGAAFGGIVATNNPEIDRKMKLHQNYGVDYSIEDSLSDIANHAAVGYNLKMHPVDAALVLAKMPYFDSFRESRKHVFDWYEQYLSGVHNVILPTFRPESEPVIREYVVRIRSTDKNVNMRDLVYKKLIDQGVQASLNYSPAVPLRIIGKEKKYLNSENVPVCIALSPEILSLPADPMITEQEVQTVCDIIRDVMDKQFSKL